MAGPCINSEEVKQLVRDLARNRMEAGITDPADITAAVHTMIAPHVPGITPQEVADIYSGHDPSGLDKVKKGLTQQQRLKAYKARGEKRLADLGKQADVLRKGKIPPKKPTPEQLKLDDEAKVLQHNLHLKQREVQQLYRDVTWKNKSRIGKALTYAAQGVRFGMLTNPRTLLKIGSSVGQAAAVQPAMEPLGGAFGRLSDVIAPGKTKAGVTFREMAPRHAYGMSAAAEKAAWAGTANSFRPSVMWDILKTGETHDELGRPEMYPQEIPGKVGTVLAVPGRLHAVEKNWLGSGEGARSLEKNLQAAERRGFDRNDPAVQEAAKAAALSDKRESVLLGDNVMMRVISRGESALSENARQITRIAEPIRRVPTNYLTQTIGEYMLGSVRGIARMLRARNPEVLENMTQVEAEKTFRMLKRGAVGLFAMAAAGVAPATILGGYYSGRRKPGDIMPKQIKIPGTDIVIPQWLAHSPPIELAQMIATVKRALIDGQGKRSTSMSLLAGAASTGKGVAEETPFLGDVSAVAESLDAPNRLGNLLGRMVAGHIEPGIMSEMAAVTDREDRKPSTFGQQLAMGVPGLRQGVPVKSPGGKFNAAVQKEFETHGFAPGEIKRKADEDDTAFAERRRGEHEALDAGYAAMIASDEYRGMSKTEQAEALKEAAAIIRAEYAEQHRVEPTPQQLDRRVQRARIRATLAPQD